VAGFDLAQKGRVGDATIMRWMMRMMMMARGGSKGKSINDSISEHKCIVTINIIYSITVIIRVASQFGISVWYHLVFSRYFTNRYRKKTWSGHFGIVHLAGIPFFPQREASAPFLMDQAPFLREK
jgi:hypothetical protein